MVAVAAEPVLGAWKPSGAAGALTTALLAGASGTGPVGGGDVGAVGVCCTPSGLAPVGGTGGVAAGLLAVGGAAGGVFFLKNENIPGFPESGAFYETKLCPSSFIFSPC